MSEFWVSLRYFVNADSAASFGLPHLQFAALAVANVERHGDDPLDITLGILQRHLVDQPMPRRAGRVPIVLFVETQSLAGGQHALVVGVGLLRAEARHQLRRGAADGVLGVDAEDAGHVAVHQQIAQFDILDIDHRRHGIDHLLQQPAAFGDRLLGAFLVGDVAYRTFVAHDLTIVVADCSGAVGQPQDLAVAPPRLVLEFAHEAVAFHDLPIVSARRRIDVDGVGDVADPGHQFDRRIVAHHPRQRGIGVEQFSLGRRHVDAVDRALEQLAVAFLGETLLRQRMYRSQTRGISLDQGAAEHFRGAGDVADLVVDIGGGDRGGLLARGQRADRLDDRRQRIDGPAHHVARGQQSDQHAGAAEHDALPFVFGQRAGEVARQHPAAPLAEIAQQIGDLADLTALAAQHVFVEFGDLAIERRQRDDRIGIVLHGAACPRRVEQQGAQALRRPFGVRRIVCQQRGGDPASLAIQIGRERAIGHGVERDLESLPQRRKRRDQFGAARNQRGYPLDAVAIVLQPRRDPVDHLLLVGRQFQAGLLDQRVQRRSGFPDLAGLAAGYR